MEKTNGEMPEQLPLTLEEFGQLLQAYPEDAVFEALSGTTCPIATVLRDKFGDGYRVLSLYNEIRVSRSYTDDEIAEYAAIWPHKSESEQYIVIHRYATPQWAQDYMTVVDNSMRGQLPKQLAVDALKAIERLAADDDDDNS